MRAIIREALTLGINSDTSPKKLPRNKMSLSALLNMQTKLDRMLDSGELDRTEHLRQWLDVLATSGWTEKEYSDEIDRRWGYIDRDLDTPGLEPRDYGSN